MARKSASTTTSRGEWNAPTRFLPSGRSKPVLPPVEASTIESSVVGTLIQSIPRIQVADAKPTRSPVTPPPTAATRSRRPSPAAANALQSDETVPTFLWRSPEGMDATSRAAPSPNSPGYSRATVSSAAARSPASTAPAIPRPTTTSELPRSNHPSIRSGNDA